MAMAFGTIPHSATGTPEKFSLHVSDSQIQDFRISLAASKVGPETWYNSHETTRFGTTRTWLAGAKEAWLKLDWREQEKRINSFPNFKISIKDTGVGPTSIHFVGLFSTKEDALPLLLLHGWPGSFLEFLPLLDILKTKYTPETMPYHVIVPSLPHYGLSDGPADVELTMEIAARLLNQLMLDLGFGTGYVVQGGDIGSFLARILSATFPQCKAFHVNMLAPGSQTEILSLDNSTQEEQQHVDRMFKFTASGSSYLLEQGLRPSTIGLVLSSSPLALLAWIGEKFIEWPDHRFPLPIDTILTMASFYWYTDTFPRSVYPYRSIAGAVTSNAIFTVPTSKEKPFGYSVFPSEIMLLPQAWAKEVFPNLVFYRRNDKGGHFAALEQPHLFLQNVEDFLTKVKPIVGL
ncbi:epoxide hydrolase [Fusarium oxysporum f. sp. phaseoli]